MNQFGYDFDPDKPSDYKLICKHADTILEKIMEKTTNSNSISFYLSCFKSLLEHRKGCSKAFDKFAKAHIALKNDYIERIGENSFQTKKRIYCRGLLSKKESKRPSILSLQEIK